MRPFQLRYLNEQFVALLSYKIIADSTMQQQDIVIGDYKLIVTKQGEQITNLEVMNTQTRKTWRARCLGFGIGGFTLGALLGLLIPIIFN